jgi:hypothetical protein
MFSLRRQHHRVLAQRVEHDGSGGFGKDTELETPPDSALFRAGEAVTGAEWNACGDLLAGVFLIFRGKTRRKPE